MTIASCTSFVSSRFQNQFRRFFGWLGIQIYRKPWLFVLIGSLLTLSCSSGFYFYKDESDGMKLWIPRDSEAWSHHTTITSTFGSYPQKMILLLVVNDESDSILSPTNMDIAFDIFNDMDNIELDLNGNTYTYNELCLRPYPTAPICISKYSNIFGFFFHSNSDLWQNSTTIDEIINVNDSAIQGFAGDLERSNTGYSAKSLLFIYEVAGSTNETEQEIAREFLLSFADYWSVHQTDYPEMQIEFISDRSYDDEAGRAFNEDIPIFIAAVISMLLYLIFTLGQFSCIGARPWLAGSAVLVLLCSISVGFGISFFIGTEFNTICALTPYIVLGVGVDDMIILVDTYQRTKITDVIINEEIRLSKALAVSGLSISLTSFCSSLAFFIGSTTDVPAMSSFCMFAAWCFLANYVLQFLVFVPLMVYDYNRILKQNNSCCPCCIHHEQQIAKNNESKTYKFKMKFFVTECIVPILSKRIFRWIIILLFFAILGGSLYSSFYLKTGLDGNKLVPDDSYILGYLETVEERFGTKTVHDLNIIIENQDISKKKVRAELYTLFNALEQEPDAIGKVQEWITPFVEWVKVNKKSVNGTSINVEDLSRTIFYQYLQQFANDSIYTAWDSEIIYNDVQHPTEIAATRFLLTAFRSIKIPVVYNKYLHWNEICDEYIDANDAFIFERQHGYSVLEGVIFQITIENMFFAAGGVFSVLVLLLDCRMALFVLLIVVMIDIDLFGWMYIFDISLDAVSYTQLVMAVGLTVDYVIHITHAIYEALAGLQEVNDILYIQKLKFALGDMGTSVLKGAFTTFLGVAALGFSQSLAFRTFFYMFLGIIFIAVAHGILLVPALLGEFKFIVKGTKYSDDDDNNNIKLESHHNLSNYNDNNGNGDGVMAQLLSLKQKQRQFETDLNKIMENVNKLKNGYMFLRKETENLRDGKEEKIETESIEAISELNNDSVENGLELAVIHLHMQNILSVSTEQGHVIDENNTNKRNKVKSDIDIDDIDDVSFL